MRNLRLAIRTLRRTPLVTGIAVLSLALGIGANTAIYSLFNELLIQPLPVPHPEQLVLFGGNMPAPGSHQSTSAGKDTKWVFSYPMFRDLESRPGPFSGVAAHEDFVANVVAHGNTRMANGEYVSGSYFPVLGIKPAIGRLFSITDDRVIGGHPFVILSHAYWTNQLGSDPTVIGQVMIVNGQPLRIVGVSARGFEGTTIGYKADFFVPITMRGRLDAGFNGYLQRRYYWVYIFARLQPHVTLTQAAARENVLYHRIINDVEVPLQKGVSESMLARFKAKPLALLDGRRGSGDLGQDTRMPLLLLFGTALFVLAIACANIANLLLARAATRSTEVAVRLSLGATQAQLFAQLLTESLLLATIGGLAGLAVAWVTLRGMVLLLPENVASSLAFTLNARAASFTVMVSVTTGLLVGLFPALQAIRPDIVNTLRNGSGKTSATRGSRRFRTALVTAQIALSTALLASAGLFIRSLENVSRVTLGVDIDGLTTFRVMPTLNGYAGSRMQEVYAAIEREVAAVPGVRSIAASRVQVIGGNNWTRDLVVQGYPRTPDLSKDSYYNAVGPGFFSTIGERIVSGREFTASDVLHAPRVAVVNEMFVKKFNLGSDPVGKMIGEGDTLTHVIVGVVSDSRYSDVKQELRPVYFLPYKQDTTAGAMSFYVRSAVTPNVLLPRIRAAVTRVDPTLPILGLKTMPQQIREDVYLDRMITTLTAAFAALATLLAAIGLYGVLAYSVVQRTKEIGVRIALGADPRAIVVMVLRSVGTMTMAGALIGIVAAVGIGRATQSLLFGVNGSDPTVLLAAAIGLTVVAFAAGSIPAWRATRVDPVTAVKYE